jgi:hypothetical protein
MMRDIGYKEGGEEEEKREGRGKEGRRGGKGEGGKEGRGENKAGKKKTNPMIKMMDPLKILSAHITPLGREQRKKNWTPFILVVFNNNGVLCRFFFDDGAWGGVYRSSYSRFCVDVIRVSGGDKISKIKLGVTRSKIFSSTGPPVGVGILCDQCRGFKNFGLSGNCIFECGTWPRGGIRGKDQKS